MRLQAGGLFTRLGSFLQVRVGDASNLRTWILPRPESGVSGEDTSVLAADPLSAIHSGRRSLIVG